MSPPIDDRLLRLRRHGQALVLVFALTGPAQMPPVNTGLLEGQLAWRQHDGGHTDGPNRRYFMPWADRLLARGR